MTTPIDDAFAKPHLDKWKKAQENLERLQELANLKDPIKLKEKYRQLPLTPLLLFAYYFDPNRQTIDRWKLFKKLDKSFTVENAASIQIALNKTIVKLKEIVQLRKIAWAMTSKKLIAVDKWDHYTANPKLFEKIKDRIFTILGFPGKERLTLSPMKKSDLQDVLAQTNKMMQTNACKTQSYQAIANQVETELKTDVAPLEYKTVIDKMIWIIKNNYNCPLDHTLFQKECRGCKTEQRFFFELL
ncbi:MAG: hypothetical protein HYX67_03015 [Candidatus Melainabacteria bacterium]|nr:hypothetical protein [Candidatus Melainabacteria bacterium]